MQKVSVEMQECHIYVSGTVQGVGFRAAVKRHATMHDIKGYVRNMPDGRVEICAQGLNEQILSFVKTVESRPGLGSISEIETTFKPIQEAYFSFEIR